MISKCFLFGFVCLVLDHPSLCRLIYFLPVFYLPGDLLLDGLGVGLCEQVQQCAAEVVRVTVGVAQLVGNGIEEQIST